ncbi:glutamyl aminopeptidase-like isoform X2 [Chrysoperla carnea]|uniref:glutamyl aminopeptidase-like isoform X2 n=1 Tax=Chrysoperla carnea TaxID=189513 RepID=UPI001D08F64F|nr:glutamyl aminopeptidase-like isoform X2 [Chrysoperla carnea]
MVTMKYLFITALIAVIFINAANPSPVLEKAQSYRLNNKVNPINYKIDLTTNLKELKFNGEVNIKFEALEATNTIRFHAVDLKFTSLVLESESPSTPLALNTNDPQYQEAGQFWELILENDLIANSKYSLIIKFEGVMKEGDKEGKGYYFLKYKSEDKDKIIAITQFEPIYARKVFPCFDEPELKATFDITLQHDKDYIAYFNSKVASKTETQTRDDGAVTTFKQTPVMSTYLVAFALVPSSDFDLIVADEKDSRTQILIRKNIDKEQLKYLLPKTSSYLQEFEKLTGVKYDETLGKITHLSIPNHATGGMENWGLIVYGEDGVVYNHSIDPFSKKFGSQRVIAHELSHQWFGNLVTPAWWTDLWLKEGFASYFEYIIMDAAEPGEYGTLNEYLGQVHHKFFKNDSSKNGRAMDKSVVKPEDIENNFDVVQYEKGGQLLQMLENIIGTELFRKGIQNYVELNKYKSVTPDNLWVALQETIDNSTSPKKILADKKISDIGKSWSKAGYPVIHVAIDNDNKKLKFTQKRFLTDSKKTSRSRWIVPINFITDKTETKDIGNTAPTHWLEGKTLEVDSGDIKFVIANNEQTGYYRVNYDDSNWKAISDHLNTEEEPVVSTVTQAQLLDDAFTFAENGDLKYEVAIDLTRFLENVDEFFPWKSTAAYLINLYDKISMTPTLEKYQKYLGKITKKAFEKVSFQSEYQKNADGLLQEKLLPLVVRAYSSEFIAKSEEIMNELKDETSKVLKKFQRYVFCGAATKEFEYLMEQLKAKETKHDADDILFGLSCLSNIDNIEKVLQATDDKFGFVKFVAEINPLIIYEHNEIFKAAVTDEDEIHKIMEILAVRIGTEDQLQKLTELNQEEYKDLLKLAGENQKWNKDNEDFHNWVKENVDPSDPSESTPGVTPEPPPESTPGETPEPPPAGALSVTICLSMLVSTVIIAFLM